MTATRVQSASNTSDGAASLVVDSTVGWVAPTAGNTLLAWANCDITMSTPTGFTASVSVVDGNGVYFWWKVAAGSETSITFPAGSSTSPLSVGVVEYAGTTATPLDAATASPSTQGSGTSSPSVTTTGTNTAGDIFIAIAGLHSTAASTTAPTWTNGFTNFVSVGSPTQFAPSSVWTFVADFQNTAAAAVSTSCSWTGAANDRQELLIAFKLAAGGAAPATVPPMASFIRPIGRR